MATHEQAENRVHLGFWIHLCCYTAVIAALAVLNYQRNPDKLWVLWVAGGWGIGIVAHAAAYFFNRERMIDRTQARLARQEGRVSRREPGHNALNMTDKMSQASHRPL
jgi:hypothetical protein